MIERTFRSWMQELNGMDTQQVTTAHAIELAQRVQDSDEIIRLTNLQKRGITFMDIAEAMKTSDTDSRGTA